MATNKYNAPDYYQVDELYSDEHKLIRGSVRDWVNRVVMPEIDEYNQNHQFPVHVVKEIGALGGFGPYLSLIHI